MLASPIIYIQIDHLIILLTLKSNLQRYLQHIPTNPNVPKFQKNEKIEDTGK